MDALWVEIFSFDFTVTQEPIIILPLAQQEQMTTASIVVTCF